MKRQRYIPVLAAVAVTLSGCDIEIGPDYGTLHGSGYVVAESRRVRGVAGVEISGAGYLLIEQTGYESLVIEGDDNILPFVRSDMVGDNLILGPDRPGGITTSRQIEYHLTVRDLDEIRVSGASTVVVDWLDTRFLAVSMSGASVVEIAGVVDVQEVNMSGASRFRGLNFESLVTRVGASGSSSALVNVLEELRADLSGASSVRFIGRPHRVYEATSGGSWVGRY